MGSGVCGAGGTITIDGERVRSVDKDFPEAHHLECSMPSLYALREEDDLRFKEFVRVFDLHATPMLKRLFEVYDEDHSGTLEPEEFILAMRHWQTISYPQRLQFAYKIYDLNGDGNVSWKELQDVLIDTNQELRSPQSCAKTVSKMHRWVTSSKAHLDKNDTQCITEKQFGQLAHKYPSVLFLPLNSVVERLFAGVDSGEAVPDIPVGCFDKLLGKTYIRDGRVVPAHTGTATKIHVKRRGAR